MSLRSPAAPPSEAQQKPIGGKEATILEHLLELRNRLIVACAAVLICTVISFLFVNTVLDWLEAPARERVEDFRPVQNQVLEFLQVYFRIGLMCGLILSMPVVVYEILAFVTPGLTPREKKLLFPALFGITIFFLLGCAFAYFIVLPPSLGFLLTFGDDVVDDFINIGDYVNFTTRLIFWMGVAFETPMVLAVLAWLGVVRAKQLVKFWRYAILLAFLLAAIITPTIDPLTQGLVAGPILILYIIGIVLAAIVQPKKPRSEWGAAGRE